MPIQYIITKASTFSLRGSKYVLANVDAWSTIEQF